MLNPHAKALTLIGKLCTHAHIGRGLLGAQGADGTKGDSGSDSGVFVNKIVSCVLNKNLLPYTPDGLYFVLTSSEVQINGARSTLACAWWPFTCWTAQVICSHNACLLKLLVPYMIWRQLSRAQLISAARPSELHCSLLGV